MNTLIKNLTGMGTMTDQVIAMDFLIAAKTGIQNYAVALTETASPDIKTVLRKQLDEAISTHEEITNYMMRRGYYRPYHIPEQIELDRTNIQTALNLPT
ncbi:spore coat protein [Paenibacillus tyrfis]|uniref:spore coat protein n=1 Tax=Paenibacillus TaxID=44249 RepID=UPI00248F65F2|nr:spore coat protein [Paenibacillus tyrfis]GLI05694.1 spore coat protein [Paenibacillus tyrfis]GMX67160.1 spore coat protein [Paenibacillus elgii]